MPVNQGRDLFAPKCPAQTTWNAFREHSGGKSSLSHKETVIFTLSVFAKIEKCYVRRTANQDLCTPSLCVMKLIEQGPGTFQVERAIIVAYFEMYFHDSQTMFFNRNACIIFNRNSCNMRLYKSIIFKKS